MAKKAVLGRGLDALLSTATETREGTDRSDTHRGLYDFEDRVIKQGRVSEIPIDLISANPYQPRTSFNEDALAELATSIKQLGIIQPLTVRHKEDNSYELISGERRLRASRMAGLTKVPAYVREADVEAMLEMAIVENIQRENLDPIEIAVGYQRLIDECGLTQEHVADKVGKSRSTVTNILRLLKLSPDVQALLRSGKLSVGHARSLLAVDDQQEQTKLAQRVIREDLSVRSIEQIVRDLNSPEEKKTAVQKPVSVVTSRDSLQVQTYTDAIRGKFGTHVHIKRDGGNGGRIEISFYSDDDLDRLAELLLE
ncbi:MAG: ParB/RepB/Spo0J family partition protein [Rhodothermales bacterium]|nr:ParB/RepB/Spo0J family partition protein [Rhodothermales bacterium]